jgi:flagellar hook-associated protein 3 FlgL
MAINGVTFGNTILGQSVLNLQNQLTSLQGQLTSGKKSNTYAGLGVNEGFAIAARSQLSEISAFTDTATNVNTNIGIANTGLQSLADIVNSVQNSANRESQALNSAGQTIGQQNATSQLSTALGILNTQSGNRFVFSGSAVNTPSVASIDDILNGTVSQAGLKQVISERQQADLGTSGLGRLLITPPPIAPSTSVQVSEDAINSPFGLKLNAISSTLTGGATVTPPTGSPAAISVTLGGNPNNGDQVSFKFSLPDGTTEQIQLTASSANPPPTGSFAIGATPTATAGNLSTALTSAIGTLANTSLVAASAVAAGNDFFNSVGTVTGSVVNNKAAAPITGATLLSGAAATDSLSTNFGLGDTITVNGQTLTFEAAGTAVGPNQINVNDNVGTLLAKIDGLSGTSTPSTVSGGAITLHNDASTNLTVTSSNTAALVALGFPATGTTATQPPLRVNGPPFGSATSLVDGTANTVAWYTGEAGSGSARATATARVDQSVTVQYGIRANEQGIRSEIQTLAVFSAVTTSTTNPNGAAQVNALSERVATNLTSQPGQQTIQEIQTDLATAQSQIKDAKARQEQSQSLLQGIIDQAEAVSPDQVASQILALQTNLQASFQTTALLAQLNLTKFLPVA